MSYDQLRLLLAVQKLAHHAVSAVRTCDDLRSICMRHNVGGAYVTCQCHRMCPIV
eukprot:COSAG01_NODE_47648_length_388_cov_1.062284_1_plen_54_part_01